MERFVGLDFGTTNSSLAVRKPGEREPSLTRFADGRGGTTSTFRSVLYFEEDHVNGRLELRSLAGPEAIERYRAQATGNTRLIQSLKSYLASSLFTSTAVFGRPHTLEDLVTQILRGIRRGAVDALGPVDAPVRGLKNRLELERRWHVEPSEDGWLRIRFASRGIGLEGDGQALSVSMDRFLMGDAAQSDRTQEHSGRDGEKFLESHHKP